MQEAIVKLLKADMTNCYLISWPQGSIIVDTGTYSFWGRMFLRAASIDLKATLERKISAIFITHGHFDHIGTASRLSKAADAPIFIHDADYKLLKEEGKVPAEPLCSWARFVMKLAPLMMAPKLSADFMADAVFGEDGADFHSIGLPARIIHTPGHTPGSSALVLDDGRAFIGDMAMSGFPSLSLKPKLPIFGNNTEQNINSWRKLLDKTGSLIFYPGHGRSFTRDEAERMLACWPLLYEHKARNEKPSM